MFPIVRNVSLVLLVVLILGWHAGAQTNDAAARGLTAVVTNGSVTLSWPVMPHGTWQLVEQQPAFTGDWKPVPAAQYQTNSLGVSATLSLPAKPALYRLKPTFNFQGGALTMPPMPPMPTNLPRPPKLPEHP